MQEAEKDQHSSISHRSSCSLFCRPKEHATFFRAARAGTGMLSRLYPGLRASRCLPAYLSRAFFLQYEMTAPLRRVLT